MNKSTRISRVDVKRGTSTRTDSTLSIFIEKSDLSDVLAYMDAYEASETPTGKIRRIELVMYSEDDLKEVVELPDTEELDIVLIEEGEEITALNYAYNNGWLSKEYYDKEIDKLKVTKVNASNQPDLDIYEVK
jgi:hypothetical protein